MYMYILKGNKLSFILRARVFFTTKNGIFFFSKYINTFVIYLNS